jgi:ABC-type branched-subunit amino acid transport system permease subunit
MDRKPLRRSQLCRARHPRLLAGVILAVATIAGIYWLLRTKRGLALAAVRDNIEAAKSVGVDAAG